MALQPHQVRVLDECKALDDRIQKLGAFLASEKAATQVDATELNYMGEQFKAMRAYSHFLHLRMQHWPHD